MNSEELEASLRTEFESYLKEIFVEMRQELIQLQEKVATEIDRHKSTLDETFNEVMSRVDTDKELDASFKDTVMEHLRQSRDEGARITLTAIEDAKAMDEEVPVAVAPQPSIGVKELYEAISDISAKKSQPEILKSLVHHAANFAPRGAFFILKNEHLVGWRVFGKDRDDNEAKVREVFLSVNSESILSSAVKSLDTVEGTSGSYSEDSEILNKLEFSEPQKMIAIPLVARGRGVAVLYADQESDGAEINIEALQTLTRVAGLTVEVLASAKTPVSVKTKKVAEFTEDSTLPTEEIEQSHFSQAPESSYQAVTDYEIPVEKPVVESYFETSFEKPVVTSDFDHEPVKEEVLDNEPVSYRFDANEYHVEDVNVVTPVPSEEKYSFDEDTSWKKPKEESSWNSALESTQFSAQEYAENFAKETDPSEYAKDFAFQPSVETTDSIVPGEEYEFETTQSDFQIEKPKEDFFSSYDAVPIEPIVALDEKFDTFEIENVKVESFTDAFETAPLPTIEPIETVSQPVSVPTKTRLSERNVDLPIEVSEDERRLHNDARRFARLLVSEIKLYNELKVKEGRDSNDIYERLREAIDRSREMYDKRVQPPVAAKFDYFHYELLNTLAEGDESKLGAGYPGSSI